MGTKPSHALDYLAPILNEHGPQGWELVTLVPAADFDPKFSLAFVAIFRRRTRA
jgi:hypothetical protein